MTVGQANSVDQAANAVLFEALAYEAPFLVEKLVKDRFVETPEEGEALFAEVKRFLVLVASDERVIWDMYSLRIDEAWHQFVLFTRQYVDFCQRFFGRYMHHSPSNAPESKTAPAAEASSFARFQQRYEELFGGPLPSVWYDHTHVTVRRRILNDRAGMLTVSSTDDMVDLVSPRGDVLLSANEIAREALAFIARTGAFYVRELPGDLDDEEKIGLVATLVEHKMLRLGS